MEGKSYIFGQGTPWSYDQLQSKRKIAEQIMQNMRGTPRNVGEGLNAIGDALMVRGINKRAEKEEGRLRSEADALWSQVSGGGDMNAIVQALNNPLMGPGQKAVLTTRLDRMMNPPAAPKPIEVGGVLLDPNTYEPIFDSRTQDRQIREDANGIARYVDNGEPVFPGVEIQPDAPDMTKVTLSDGSEVLTIWNPEYKNEDGTVGALVPAPIPQGGTSGTGARTKLTESQAKTTLFKALQSETSPVLSQIEQKYDPANLTDAAARSVPIAGAFFESEEGKIYAAASAQWAEGALRIATGAAATTDEINRTVATYFARPGDTPSVIAFKKGLRESYERSIRKSLGETDVEGTLELPTEFAARLSGSDNPPPPPVVDLTREDAISVIEGLTSGAGDVLPPPPTSAPSFGLRGDRVRNR